MVHAETSTGMRQPIEAAQPAARTNVRDAILIVRTHGDSRSVPISGRDRPERHRRKLLLFSKGDRGAPGPLPGDILRTGARRRSGGRKAPPKSWYLDVALIDKYWSSDRVYHHTFAGADELLPCAEALEIILEEGLENRWARA